MHAKVRDMRYLTAKASVFAVFAVRASARPVFSGMCARHFNENGEKASSRAVCERLYALAGGVLYNKKEAKDSFYDVIIGSNGRFDALIGYDLCTGLGVPTR